MLRKPNRQRAALSGDIARTPNSGKLPSLRDELGQVQGRWTGRCWNLFLVDCAFAGDRWIVAGDVRGDPSNF